MEPQNPNDPVPTDDNIPLDHPQEPVQEDQETAQQTTTDTTMEIHTHGHVHEDKKWKEYLFQFLMLFLAITAVFFMENQREHYIEHQRAKVMGASLIEDLKADTLEITTSSKQMLILTQIADSMMLQLKKPRPLQI